MTETPSPSEDRYAHLRNYAARQKQATLDRLNQAITQLEQEKRPVTTFTIKEVSGLDYMAYYRNTEALALFRRHSTHLRKERQKEQSKRRGTKRHPPGQQETMVSSRDPLLNYKSLAWSLNCVRHAPDVIKWSSSIKPSCKNICNVDWLLLVWRPNWPSIWLFWSGFAHLYKMRNMGHRVSQKNKVFAHPISVCRGCSRQTNDNPLQKPN